MKSMTAFGRGTAHSENGQVVIELSSLNRKYLEITTHLPSEFEPLDADIRSWIGQQVARGAIKAKLTATYAAKSPMTVKSNISLAAQIKQACDQLAQALHLGDAAIMIQEVLANRHDVLQFDATLEDEGAYKKLVKEALATALNELMEMKRTEGKALKEDLISRIELIRRSLHEIGQQALHATGDYRQKLMERIEELLPGAVENEERILREVALFAEKIDIAEELTRAESHLVQLETLIHSDELSIGKTCEFLLQELLRESNTIGSKSSNVTISHQVVAMKSEIERMKEQIRNVE